MKNPLLKHDKKLIRTPGGLIGIDEAGRGAFAGPVVAAAAWLSKEFYKKAGPSKGLDLIQDSKQLTPEKRNEAFKFIEKWAKKGLIKFHAASASVKEIENRNILGATRLAMKRGLESLMLTMPIPFRVSKISGLPLWDRLDTEHIYTQAQILVDGLPLRPFDYTHQAIIDGDCHSLAIAAASIVAKVTRDRLMIALSKEYPAYGFEEHKGYGTESHREAILKEGPSDIHRTLFLRNLLDLNQTPDDSNPVLQPTCEVQCQLLEH